MKLSPINSSFSYNIMEKKELKKKNEYNNINYDNDDIGKQQVFASNITFKNLNGVPLLQRYKTGLQRANSVPIETFLSLEAPKEELNKLAIAILKDENLSFDFIKSLTMHPRKVKHYREALSQKLPNNNVFSNIYFYDNEYKLAYEKYIQRRVNETQSISELLQIRPDWSEDFLLKKHQDLYHNADFELGVIPNEIGAYNFDGIMNHLKYYHDYGFKTKQLIPDLNLNGRTFKFEKLIDGRSDKNVFLLITPENKKYVIKTNDSDKKGLNKPFAIGTCCIIDQYLTMNNCRNSAPLKYYNHNRNTAIYDYIEHETTSKINSLNGFIDYMPDFSDLGLYHSDTVGTNNYFKLNEKQEVMKGSFDFQYGVDKGELVSVDNDHVIFNLGFSPMVDNYHKYLPTGMQMFN